MKILITGHSGFLGKHVIKELKSKNHNIVFFKKTKNKTLLDEKWTFNQIFNSNADAVIHLAAKCGGIGANMEKPGEFFYDNLKMGINVIEACRLANIKKILIVGTVCSYPKFTPVPFREENIWNGFPEETNAPYGIAKKALLTMLHAYRKQYGMNGIYLIPVNLYGPGDNFNPKTSHVIPALIKKFHEAKIKNKKYVECWGSGNVSREFLFVKDAARGIADGLEKYNLEYPVNLGNGKEYKIHEIANKIKLITSFDGDIIWNKEKPDGQPRRCLEISRAKEYFNFEAKVSLDQGLKETYKWFLKQEKK